MSSVASVLSRTATCAPATPSSPVRVAELELVRRSMLAIAQAPHLSFGGILFDTRLILEVIVAVLAIRAYRHNPTKPLRLLRCGFLCLALTDVAMFAFGGLAGFAFPELRRIRWVYYVDPIALITCLALVLMAFQTIIRERSASSTTNV